MLAWVSPSLISPIEGFIEHYLIGVPSTAVFLSSTPISSNVELAAVLVTQPDLVRYSDPLAGFPQRRELFQSHLCNRSVAQSDRQIKVVTADESGAGPVATALESTMVPRGTSSHPSALDDTSIRMYYFAQR